MVNLQKSIKIYKLFTFKKINEKINWKIDSMNNYEKGRKINIISIKIKNESGGHEFKTWSFNFLWIHKLKKFIF